ncbi:hypothetical protein KQH49_04380 [Mycetohabitans sp. B5]|uniref:Uncharacterized protein n=1 Tax=Mycetohabitans endofungorum TaxID=417203 RepID=A0A2P5K921_9BURK|nr:MULTISPECIES: hypothetical protein [Mycetohabitans]MCG1054239.1 hypothetical protein [Mycetohabitans sp. B5]PPB83204.1 hypothetical protein B0O95_10929 [Mycetohabitans endofungorum]
MGWIGTLLLGVAIGGFGWWRHPARRAAALPALIVGALAAGAVKLAGNASGLFEDGEVLEWSLCVLGAMTAVAVAVTASLGSHLFRR